MQYTTSEPHKETTAARRVWDIEDMTKLGSALELYSPLSAETSLRNIVTGIIADHDVNELTSAKRAHDTLEAVVTCTNLTCK